MVIDSSIGTFSGTYFSNSISPSFSLSNANPYTFNHPSGSKNITGTINIYASLIGFDI